MRQRNHRLASTIEPTGTRFYTAPAKMRMAGLAETHFDCAIVGAGIVGLAHALAARRAGLRVVVLEREARAIGASIRNFGFVTVTGQEKGDCWRRARRARDIWAEVAPQAGIAVHHRGLVFAARRPEALAVLEEFAAGPMGEGCRMLTAAEAAGLGALRPDLAGAMHSPHELRVESRDAIPRLTAWLAEAQRRASSAPSPRCMGWRRAGWTAPAGRITADRIIVCPGTDIRTLFPEVFARRAVTLCKLHMLRVAAPGFALPGAVMSDLGLVRYLGYADGPSLPTLAARLQAEQAAELSHGIHLIVVQGADGSLVVGDCHHYAASPDPFQPAEVDDLILRRAFAGPRPAAAGGAGALGRRLSLRPRDGLLRAAAARGACWSPSPAAPAPAPPSAWPRMSSPPGEMQHERLADALYRAGEGSGAGLGRHRGGPWQPRADGGLRPRLRAVGRRDLHRRCARADGHGQGGPYPRRRRAAIAPAWRAKHGRDFSEADVQAIFDIFEPMNVAAIKDHAALIPGVAETLASAAPPAASASAPPPAIPARSWPNSRRWPPRRASCPKSSSAPATCRPAARRRCRCGT